MHEQSLENNLAMSESIVHKNSSHMLKATTIVDIKSLTRTNDNQSNSFNNNNTILTSTRTVEHHSKKISDFIASSRHVFEATTSTETVVLDSVNNNSSKMSHKNFTLAFDSSSSSSPSQPVSSDMLSPAEVPFGRRYAEISQFKNHPNIEW